MIWTVKFYAQVKHSQTLCLFNHAYNPASFVAICILAVVVVLVYISFTIFLHAQNLTTDQTTVVNLTKPFNMYKNEQIRYSPYQNCFHPYLFVGLNDYYRQLPRTTYQLHVHHIFVKETIRFVTSLPRISTISLRCNRNSYGSASDLTVCYCLQHYNTTQYGI